MGLGKTYSTKYLLDSNNNSGAAGQVLSTTSTGIDWVDANTVPGSGLWLESGNNIYNSNSGNVGVGTTSPTAKLELGTNDFVMVNTGTGGRAGILFNEVGTPSATNVQYGARISYAESGDVLELVMRENNVDKLGIAIARQTGNVGIGTDSPGHLFHVYAGNGVAVNSYTALVQNAEATAGDNFGLKVQAGKNSSDVTMEVSNASGSSYIRVRGDGNVGIGTTSPTYKLQR